VGPYGVHLPSGEPYPEQQMPFERVLRARGPVVVDDLVIHRHDGARTFLRVFAAPLFDEGQEVSYVVEAFTDVTREMESERQVQLSMRMESIGSLAAGIAHDFNNLLSIMKLVVTNLRRGERAPARLELLQHLDSVADSAALLTRNLWGFAQQRVNEKAPEKVNPLIRKVLELVRSTFEPRIALSAALTAKADVVMGDGSQLEQILMNLLLNARDAIAETGRIGVRTRNRRLAANEHPSLPAGLYLELEIDDSGGGIEPSIRERIFEPYFTTKTEGAQRGTGLGLATVYRLAQTHGGLADVATTGPEGTTFRVLLPALEGEQAE
jgi:signal transduction histidine kinase